MSLQQVSPDLDFWSDASDMGWGAHLGSLTASGLWDLDQSTLSINVSGGEECVRVLRHQHGCVLPSQGGGDEVTLPQLSVGPNPFRSVWYRSSPWGLSVS